MTRRIWPGRRHEDLPSPGSHRRQSYERPAEPPAGGALRAARRARARARPRQASGAARALQGGGASTSRRPVAPLQPVLLAAARIRGRAGGSNVPWPSWVIRREHRRPRRPRAQSLPRARLSHRSRREPRVGARPASRPGRKHPAARWTASRRPLPEQPLELPRAHGRSPGPGGRRCSGHHGRFAVGSGGWNRIDGGSGHLRGRGGRGNAGGGGRGDNGRDDSRRGGRLRTCRRGRRVDGHRHRSRHHRLRDGRGAGSRGRRDVGNGCSVRRGGAHGDRDGRRRLSHASRRP
jgi:hypothetical protein